MMLLVEGKMFTDGSVEIASKYSKGDVSESYEGFIRKGDVVALWNNHYDVASLTCGGSQNASREP